MLVVLKEDYKLGGRSLTTPIHQFFLEEGDRETCTILKPPTGGILPPKGGDIRGGRVSTETRGVKKLDSNRIKWNVEKKRRNKSFRKEVEGNVEISHDPSRFLTKLEILSEYVT